MIGATLLWGSTFIVIRDVVGDVPPGALVLLRFSAATLLFAPLFALRRVSGWRSSDRRSSDRTALFAGLACAPFIGACLLLQAAGLRETSAGSSAFLTSAGTLAAPLFAWALLKQRPGRRVSAGLALALIGSAVLSLREGLTLGRPELLTLLGAIAYGFQIVLVARYAPGVDPIALAGAQALGVALLLLPFAGTQALHAFTAAGAASRWRIAYVTVAGTVFAPLLQVMAQRTLSTARIALLFALEPLFALLFAITLAGERFDPRWWAGATLILFGVCVSERPRAEP